jgi:predicted aspartyl protease
VEAWAALLETLGDRPLMERVKSEPCTVRLQVAGKQPYMRIKVGDLGNQRFVFDTGATGITISPRLAKRAGLSPIKPFSIGGTGAGRTETGSLVLIDAISIDDKIVVRNLPATVRNPSGPEEGLIGPSTFSQFNITVDLDRRRVAFEPAGTETAGRTEPFRNVGGQIVISARMNDLPFNAMVDSGSTSTIVGTTTLARVPGLDTVPGRWLTGSIVGVGGPMADRRMILQGGLSVAGRGYPADGLPTGDLSGLSRALESEVHLILGFPHLDDSAFTIDYERMTVTFSIPGR